MIDGLIGLLILLLVLGLIVGLAIWLIDMLPVPATFGQVAKVLIIVIAILILLVRALPLLGVHAL